MSERHGDDFAGLGVEAMDTEHRMQLGMLEALCSALGEGRDRGEIAEILDGVLDYTHVHFMAEELLMRTHAYPEARSHRRGHVELVDALAGLRERVDGAPLQEALEAIEAVRERLRHHIGRHDSALRSFLEARGAPLA